MNATTPEQEEQEARRKFREGQAAERRMAAGREAAARQREAARRQQVRRDLKELRPRLNEARRAYDRALHDATRERPGETSEAIDHRFDVADARMNELAALSRRAERLQRELAV